MQPRERTVRRTRPEPSSRRLIRPNRTSRELRLGSPSGQPADANSTAILFKVIKSTVGLRVSEEEELAGLDVSEHGSPGYGPETVTVP